MIIINHGITTILLKVALNIITLTQEDGKAKLETN